MTRLLLLGLLACDGSSEKGGAETGTPSACPAGRRVEGRVTGAVLSAASPRVAVMDASTWRWENAPVVSEVATPDPSTGAFTLCLDESASYTEAFAKAFVGAWADLDGDDRYDVRSESLCDQGAEGWAVTYLYYGLTIEGTGWTVSPEREGYGALPDAFTPVLNGDVCTQ